MAEAVGFSSLYPLLLFYTFASSLMLLMLIPGFWKTRVFCLVANVCWVLVGNMITCIGAIGWRGHIRDIPVWADIVAALRYMQIFGSYTSMVCVGKFVWQRLRPLSAREFYDNRRKHNQIDAFLTVVLPVIWLPSRLLVTSARYFIVEDFGPIYSNWINLPGFLIIMLPPVVCGLAVAIFNILAFLTYLRVRRAGSNSEFSKRNETIRTRKLMMFSFVNVLLAGLAIILTIYKHLQLYPVSTWGPPTSIAYNLPYFQRVLYMDRASLETKYYPTLEIMTMHNFSAPSLGIYTFLWFGISREARKSYRDMIAYLLRLVGITSQRRDSVLFHTASTYWTRVRWPKSFRSSSDGLPISGIILPFTPSAVNSSDTRLPPSPIPNRRLSFGASADINRGGRMQPHHRGHFVAYQKPPPSVDAIPFDVAPLEIISSRCLSLHKPVFPAAVADRCVLGARASGNDVAPCGAPYHKPLLPSNTPTSTPATSDGTLPQRQSYHKPLFLVHPVAALGNTAPRRCSTHELSLPTSPPDVNICDLISAEDDPVEFLPIQLFLPPIRETRGMRMMPIPNPKSSS